MAISKEFCLGGGEGGKSRKDLTTETEIYVNELDLLELTMGWIRKVKMERKRFWLKLWFHIICLLYKTTRVCNQKIIYNTNRKSCMSVNNIFE